MSDYYEKLQKTLNYIEENIKEDITLEKLSALCFYSTHHYHRIFQSIIGIPVADYIRKRKLSIAASEIIDSDKNIIDIAMEYGFNSHETFSRAFKRIFDITPNDYRKLNTHAIPCDFWKVTFANSDLQKRYMRAVESLCKRLKNDVNILAIIITGSLSYDQVWEKSDIDMAIIVNDNCNLRSELCLLEDDIYINGNVMTRTELRKVIGKNLKGSIISSYLSLGTLIYCKDESIKEFFENNITSEIGERDKAYSLLQRTVFCLDSLHKAEKWLKVKSDVKYSYIFIIETLKYVSAIEVLLNNNIPSREVILQALKYNNPIIENLYIRLMDEQKNSINIYQSIDMVYEYLRQHLKHICKPILDYFDNKKDMQAVSTIVQDFNRTIKPEVICQICEWLCEEGILVKDISETHITSKSNTIVYEPAYFKSDMDINVFI